jgi:hypothetical protein
MRFIPIKTKRPVCTMMPDADVLMRDVEATYHGRARPATGYVERGDFARRNCKERVDGEWRYDLT